MINWDQHAKDGMENHIKINDFSAQASSFLVPSIITNVKRRRNIALWTWKRANFAKMRRKITRQTLPGVHSTNWVHTRNDDDIPGDCDPIWNAARIILSLTLDDVVVYKMMPSSSAYLSSCAKSVSFLWVICYSCWWYHSRVANSSLIKNICSHIPDTNITPRILLYKLWTCGLVSGIYVNQCNWSIWQPFGISPPTLTDPTLGPIIWTTLLTISIGPG